MCVAIPMRVETIQGEYAKCVRCASGETEQPIASCAFDCCGATPARESKVDISLLEDPAALRPGDWVLVFRDEALRVVSEEEAQEVTRALTATAAVMAGDLSEDTIRAGFADLIDREPPLPDHLKRLVSDQEQ